jgi:hypothetical protein
MTDSALPPGPARMVTGLFTNRESAELAYRTAARLGYEDSDIDVLMSEETRNRYFSAGHDTKTDLSSNATEDAAKGGKSADNLGGPAGGTIGTIAPALAGVAGERGRSRAFISKHPQLPLDKLKRCLRSTR